MARINLLPWREKLKKEREQRFYVITGLIAFAALVVVGIVHVEINNRLDFQNSRNQFLTQQLSVLDKEIAAIKDLEIEKTRLLNRMKIIQQLQKSRPQIVHIYEELVLALPEGAQMLKVQQTGEFITIDGIAESNSRISTFMRNMDKSDWLTNPELIVIDANKSEFPNSSWFSLKVKRSQPE